RYPERADTLRPLLEAALQVRAAGRPEMRPLARRAAKQRMLAALAQKGRAAPVSASRAPGIANRFLSLVSRVSRRLRQRPAPLLLRASLVMAVVLVSVLLGGFYQHARQVVVQRTGLLTDVVGTVEYQVQSEGVWRVAGSGLAFGGGWHIRTGKLAAATLRFFDGSATVLGADTDVLVVGLSSQRDGGATMVTLSQQLGETRNEVRPLQDGGSRFEITTPSAVASVHGTVFTIGVAQDGTTTVSVVEGSVGLARDGETEWLRAGQLTSVSPPTPTPPGPEHPAAPTDGREETKERPKQSASNGPAKSTAGPKGTQTGDGQGKPGGQPVHPSHPVHPDVPRHPKQPENPGHPTHPTHPEHPNKQG
ncbi:MAG: FecR domain-containing protein, partial [Anaerolineae bacterium]|nr:FecR domain-containing protein [Anaerolineae bacterium]